MIVNWFTQCKSYSTIFHKEQGGYFTARLAAILGIAPAIIIVNSLRFRRKSGSAALAIALWPRVKQINISSGIRVV